jgi:hypothetical protein
MEAAEAWRPLGELLVHKGLVTEEELGLALEEQADSGRLLGAILVERGYVSGPALAVALAEQYGVELATERGFGTGLWAEIDRRHRAGRGREDGDDQRREAEIVRFEPAKTPLEALPDLEPDPALERLKDENLRLQEEIERLHAEFTKLKLVESPVTPASHLLFVPTSARYLLLERDGAPPEPGDELEVEDAEARFLVSKVGPAPFPSEDRPCAFLLPLA